LRVYHCAHCAPTHPRWPPRCSRAGRTRHTLEPLAWPGGLRPDTGTPAPDHTRQSGPDVRQSGPDTRESGQRGQSWPEYIRQTGPDIRQTGPEPRPDTETPAPGVVQFSIEEQLLHRNVKRFRGGLVFEAHRLLYHSTLGLRVIKRKRCGGGSGARRPHPKYSRSNGHILS